jgi:FkbM family methyltransferase
MSKVIPVFHKLLPLPEEYRRGHFLTIKRDDVFFNVDRSDYMQWHIYAGLPDVSWKKAASTLKSGSAALDIGANCGQFSLKLAAALRRQNVRSFVIHAFEPNPDIFERLTSNLALNPELGQHVFCHAIALGKEAGEMSFAYNPANSGGGSITQDQSDTKFHHQVRIDRLDKAVHSLSLAKIGFIKIDVEGFEPEVLLGGESVIEKDHPWLYVEITPDWFQSRGHSLEQVIGKLLAWNYELFGEVDQEFISYLENEQLFRSLQQFNLLAKPLTFGE